MQKNTAQVQSYFNNNKERKVLYFVNGLPFDTEDNARAQANNLGKQKGKEYEVVTVTRDEAFAETATASEGASAGGENIEITLGFDVINDEEKGPVKTAQEQLDAAQAAYDAAVTAGVAEDIASTKKALSTAKARVTRESKK